MVYINKFALKNIKKTEITFSPTHISRTFVEYIFITEIWKNKNVPLLEQRHCLVSQFRTATWPNFGSFSIVQLGIFWLLKITTIKTTAHLNLTSNPRKKTSLWECLAKNRAYNPIRESGATLGEREKSRQESCRESHYESSRDSLRDSRWDFWRDFSRSPSVSPHGENFWGKFSIKI